jgi:hypothetical protein
MFALMVKKLTALNDSGSQCAVISRKIVEQDSSDLLSSIGSVMIQPVVGPAVPAELMAFDVTKYVTEGKT